MIERQIAESCARRSPFVTDIHKTAPGTGILAPETAPTSVNGDQDRPERSQKTPPMAGLFRQSSHSAKTADWVVETVDIELAAHHAVIETSLILSQERGFQGRDGAP
jgi:hypothetical protein